MTAGSGKVDFRVYNAGMTVTWTVREIIVTVQQFLFSRCPQADISRRIGNRLLVPWPAPQNEDPAGVSMH